MEVPLMRKLCKWLLALCLFAACLTAAALADGAMTPPVITVNGETADTFVYDWLDSAGFNFDGCQPGLYMIFR